MATILPYVEQPNFLSTGLSPRPYMKFDGIDGECSCIRGTRLPGVSPLSAPKR